MSTPATASPETIALCVGLDLKELDKSCDEALLPSLANFVHPWREVFAYLLAPIDLDDIDSENAGRSEQTKRIASLRKWKVKCGARATYGMLITSLLKNGDVQNAENICRELMTSFKNNHHEECTTSLKSNLDLDSRKKIQVSERISKLEEWFSQLKKQLLSQLKSNETVSPPSILESLAMLPLTLQAEYKKYVMENLSTLAAASSVSMLFIQLSFNFTFIDYGLLEHLIKTFGSSQLKRDMSDYAEEIQVFLDETTVSQLGEHWPGQQDLPPHFDKLLMTIDKDPGKCSLRMVNDLRKRFCSEVHLSDVVFVLIGIGKANSFLVVLMIPSVLGPKLVESIVGVDDSFYQRECIIAVSLNHRQLYLSVALRKKKNELEERLLTLCIDNTGDIQEFRYILSQPGVDPNIYDQNGWTPLCNVAYDGRTEIAELLLNCGAIVDLPNKDELGTTPLIAASQEGHVSTCVTLIQRGATVDYLNSEPCTALYKASEYGRKEVVELLLDSGASMDKPNMTLGSTALRVASVHGHREVVAVLIARGATVDYRDEEGMTPLFMASQNGHKEVAQLLLQNGAQPDIPRKDNTTPLYMASQYGRKEVVELLLDSGASVDKPNMDAVATALRVASANGHSEVVAVLIARGATVDYKDEEGMTPLFMASQNGHKEVAQLLLQNGAQPDIPRNDGATPLFMASQEGHKEVAQLLLQNGAQPDIQYNNTTTPLIIASYKGHPDVCQLLIQHGSEVNYKMETGRTALAWAAYEGHKNVVDILLNVEANPNIQDEEGLTPLMLATQCGHKEIIQSLLESKANPNITDKTSGWTALHMACKEGHVEISRLLLEGGADVDVKDENQVTPFNLAKLHGNEDICDILNNFYNTKTEKEVTEEQRDGVKKSYQRLLTILDALEEKLLPGRAEKRQRQKQSKERAANVTDSLNDTTLQV